MTIPESKIKDFSALYFSLYNPRTKGRHTEYGLESSICDLFLDISSTAPFLFVFVCVFTDRVDPGDKGGEYRSLLGLPGGTSHASYPLVEAEATKAGFKLVEGKGNDPDTLGKQIVYVMDTAKVRHNSGDGCSNMICTT